MAAFLLFKHISLNTLVLIITQRISLSALLRMLQNQ